MIFVQIKMQKYNFFCYLKKKLYLCITISERVIALNDWKSGEVPEWSNGAVSKTVDQLAGPRVRIPASPRTATLNQGVAVFVPHKFPKWGKSESRQRSCTDGS